MNGFWAGDHDDGKQTGQNDLLTDSQSVEPQSGDSGRIIAGQPSTPTTRNADLPPFSVPAVVVKWPVGG
jgi:hypothetical protein